MLSSGFVDASSSLLIRECDLLEESSVEEFLDSSGASGEELCIVKNDSDLPPTLESLLNNLTLDKPSFYNTSNTTSNITSNTASALFASTHSPSSNTKRASWLGSAFKWEPTQDGVNLITESGSTESKPIILYASKMKLIEKLTTVLDYKFMDDVLVTIEMIMHPIDFVSCLLSRIAQAFHAVPGWDQREEIDPEVVKMRGLIVLQHWASSTCSQNGFDYSIRKIVIEGIDVIWQQSRTLSQSDQRFLIKIRRLFDPRGEISVTPFEVEENGNYEEEGNASSIYEPEGFEDKKPMNSRKKWREKLKTKLKLIFSGSGSSDNPASLKRSNSNASSGFSSPSFLINSFSSDLECEDVSSFLIRERSKTLATILAVLEWDIFSEIQRSELVLFPEARESPHQLAEECSNLQRAIEHFNSMCQWFVQIILAQEDDSIALLAKLIRLAVKCILIHNYNTALQIILALQSPGISARKELWMSLPAWERRLAKDLAIFGSPIKNFKNVRKALEEVQREEIPAVPFTGLFLSDLVFNWERNSSNNAEMHSLIPVYKNHFAARIVRQFIAFQNKTHRFERDLSEKERQLYSYFADIGRLGGEFSM